MSCIVPDALLSQLSEFIAARLGLHFPRERWHDLERGFVSAARDFAYQDPESCIRWLLSSPLTRRQIEILASHLTIGETYFFREKAGFESLEKHIFPQLLRARRGTQQRLRIWSAGCSTGEEPYSIGILLTEMLPDWRDWNITILATDINALSLRRASRGVYKEWSFREIAPRLKEKYFDRAKDGHFELARQVRELVTFAHVNLADDAYPALETNTNAMDIIFCRNVLMYFEPDCARKVVRKFYHALTEGGWLIVSPAEASHVLFSQFTTCNFPGAILYKKDGSRTQDKLATEPIPHALLEEPGTPLRPPPRPEAERPSVALQETGQLPRMETWERETAAPAPTTYQEASDLYAQGRYAEAAEKIKVGLSRDSHDARSMVLLARAYANQGRLAEALEWSREAVAADQLNPGWRYLLATVLQEQDRDEEALMALKHALYLDPGYALAHFALGNLTRRQGKVRESGRHYRNTLSVLSRCRPQEPLPDAAGITAGRLAEIIRSTILGEAVNER